MPLQIRRGTDAERVAMIEKLADGELLWVTDDQKLYVGNGTTASSALPPVTGFNTEDAQDAAALLFTTATHTGISFAYDDIAGQLSATVDLSAFDGPVVADSVKGSVFADDSTILVDGLAGGRINLNGTVKGNVVPDLTSAYDIGTSSIKFKSLYLSGNGLYLGDATITSSGSIVQLPSGSTVGGVAIGTGTGSGTGDFTFTNNVIDIGTGIATLTSSNVDPFEIVTITSGDGGALPFFRVRTSKGTTSSPTTTAAGDLLCGIALDAYANGDYQAATAFYVEWAGTATLTDTNPASVLTILTNAGGTDTNTFVFNNQGAFTAPILQTGSYTGTQRDALTPAVGMMIYNTTANKFQGYQNTGGTTLEWVDLS